MMSLWVLTLLITACGGLPARSLAQDRLFLDLKLELLDEYLLPKQVFEDAPVGGLSAITYDRKSDRFYALSDDRGKFSPARFYTLKLNWQTTPAGQPQIDSVFSLSEANQAFARLSNGLNYGKVIIRFD